MISERIKGGKERMKYIATFTPQAWVNDYAISVDPQGETEYDVTAEVAALGFVPEDDSDKPDELRHAAAAPPWVREWSGPFCITIESVE